MINTCHAPRTESWKSPVTLVTLILNIRLRMKKSGFKITNYSIIFYHNSDILDCKWCISFTQTFFFLPITLYHITIITKKLCNKWFVVLQNFFFPNEKGLKPFIKDASPSLNFVCFYNQHKLHNEPDKNPTWNQKKPDTSRLTRLHDPSANPGGFHKTTVQILWLDYNFYFIIFWKECSGTQTMLRKYSIWRVNRVGFSQSLAHKMIP